MYPGCCCGPAGLCPCPLNTHYRVFMTGISSGPNDCGFCFSLSDFILRTIAPGPGMPACCAVDWYNVDCGGFTGSLSGMLCFQSDFEGDYVGLLIEFGLGSTFIPEAGYIFRPTSAWKCNGMNVMTRWGTGLPQRRCNWPDTINVLAYPA